MEPVAPRSTDFDPLVCGSWAFDEEATIESLDVALPGCGADEACLRFVDVTEESGLARRQWVVTTATALECMFPRITAGAPMSARDCDGQWATGGAAAADFDDDGWPDLYVTRLGAPDLLYRNRGDGTFEDVAREVGLGACTFTNGVTWADLDNDDDQDLLVTSFGGARHLAYINEGGCFTEDARARGLALEVSGIHGGQSVAVGDYDLDGWLDVHVNEFIAAPLMTAGEPYGARLLRNLGAGFFVDETARAGVALPLDEPADRPGAWAFASTFVDLDGDRHPELAVASDFGTARLFWNRGDGSFEDGTAAAGVAREHNAMGSTFGDFDGDGRLDWYVTSIANAPDPACLFEQCEWLGTGNFLYRNNGDRTFTDQTSAAGVRDGGWAWGAVFLELDNDGALELITVNGWPGHDLYGGKTLTDTPSRLWRREGGVYVELAHAAGLRDTGQGRAIVPLDYDRDGDLDLFITNHAGPPRLYRNELVSANHWLEVELEGARSNRDGRGAVVTLRATAGASPQVRQLGTRSQFLGEGELAAHFGLGPAGGRVHELRVYWPASDREQVLRDVEPDQRVVLVEPS